MERPRRLRRHGLIRDLVHEVRLDIRQLVQPYFVSEGKAREKVENFTDVYRWGIDPLLAQIERDMRNGLTSFLLFGRGVNKDAGGSEAYADKGLLPEAVRKLKERYGSSILLFTDVCLCTHTTHGHCGILEGDEIANDLSWEPLCRMAVVHAQAGADFVAPSDMMDGRIGKIRRALDEKGLERVGILAYTAKYASSYYGPFREAVSSSLKGDRSSYQMDFRNVKEALRELRLDVKEGADMVMVKPALPYLDIIAKFRQVSDIPIAAYSVSGEYEMVKQLAARGIVDEQQMAIENLTAIRRAGAQFIVTYFASLIAEKRWLK